MRESTQWIATAERLPEKGIVVNTISEGGIEQQLVLHTKLWYFPDMTMYVYYTPKFWKPIN